MKAKIHPPYHDIEVTCSCGNQFLTKSSTERKQLIIEVCSMCHPFYTGMQKLLDTGGRVDKFKQKYARKPIAPAPLAEKKEEKKRLAPEPKKKVLTLEPTTKSVSKRQTKPKDADKITVKKSKPKKEPE